VIDEETKARIEALCTEVEQKTGAQIAVVTVKSLDDQPIENYAHDLFKAMASATKRTDVATDSSFTLRAPIPY